MPVPSLRRLLTATATARAASLSSSGPVGSGPQGLQSACRGTVLQLRRCGRGRLGTPSIRSMAGSAAGHKPRLLEHFRFPYKSRTTSFPGVLTAVPEHRRCFQEQHRSDAAPAIGKQCHRSPVAAPVCRRAFTTPCAGSGTAEPGVNHIDSSLDTEDSEEHSSDAAEPRMVSVRFPCPGQQADALADCLLSFGAVSCSIEDANAGSFQEEEILHPHPALWDPQAERRLWLASSVTVLFPAQQSAEEVGLALRLAAQAALMGNADALISQAMQTLSNVESADWVQSVKDQFGPVQVDVDFWIVPPWGELPSLAPPGTFSIALEPGLAFGTGEHPTTRLCLRWLRSGTPRVRHGRVLDFGSGSGILSIAAVKLGAQQVVGVDIDPLALSSAQHNMGLNIPAAAEEGQLKCDAKFLLASLACPNPAEAERGDGFDVVVANILLNPLVQLAGDICNMACSGAHIGLSGVLTSQVPRVLEAYQPWTEELAVFEEEGWALISLRRR